MRLDTMGMRHSVGGRLAFVGLPYLQRAGVSRCGKGMHGYELLVQEGLIVPEASQRLRPDRGVVCRMGTCNACRQGLGRHFRTALV